MGVDGAGCGGSGSLGSQVERGEDGSSHKGPRAGIRDGTLEPWVQILTSSPSPQFPAYTLEVVTLPTQRAARFLAAPLPQPLEAAHNAKYAGVSLAGSKHVVPRPPPGLPVIPSVWDLRPTTLVRLIGLSPPHLFCKPPFALGQSTGSPPLRWAPISREPTALRLAQDSPGDSSQLCLQLALRFILLALPSHLPLVPLMSWGRQDGEGH